MGRKALQPGPIDRKIGEILEGAARERGLSHRQLALLSGVSRDRVDAVLPGVRPIYASEIQALAEALGLRASTVVAQAEAETGIPADEPTRSDFDLAALVLPGTVEGDNAVEWESA